MHFDEIECSEAVAEKIQSKHGVEPSEVEEVLANDPYTRRGREGLYYVFGQTDAGRYLFAVPLGRALAEPQPLRGPQGASA
jgi:hypothetical protein